MSNNAALVKGLTMQEELAALGGEDLEVNRHAQRIFDTAIEGLNINANSAVSVVLDKVFRDEGIEKQFFNAGIRLTTMRGRVAKKVLELIGEDSKKIGIMAIGDVRLPPFANNVARDIVARSHQIHQAIFDNRGASYDLASRGLPMARRRLMAYLDTYYGFSDVDENLLQKMAQNSCLTSGGMRGLDDIMTGISQLAKRNRENAAPEFALREFHPDNSFGTWGAIADLRTNSGLTGKVCTVPTSARNGLHLTADDVSKAYENIDKSADFQDTWCITPVGNPSGTAMVPEQLKSVVAAILENSPNAVVVLDSTYVRTLPVEKARALMAAVMHDASLLKRIVFVDSFSKTHGLCGERLGLFFSANEDLFSSIHRVNLTLSAGNGLSKDALALAISDTNPMREAVFTKLHRFWAKERAGLYQHLIGDKKYSDLFEEAQPHLDPSQLEESLGLYLFLKLKPGVTGQEVLLRTGCLGVETKMASGNYLRFAVGEITEPTYARV